MDLTAVVREGFGIPLIGVQSTGLGADARSVSFRGRGPSPNGWLVPWLLCRALSPAGIVALALSEAAAGH